MWATWLSREGKCSPVRRNRSVRPLKPDVKRCRTQSRTCRTPVAVDQLQLREKHCVILDLVGKGGRLRTVPVPFWCKRLVDSWQYASGVKDGKLFRRTLRNGVRQDVGVTSSVVWNIVKRCAKLAGIENLPPHDLRRSCAFATRLAVNSIRYGFYSVMRRCSPQSGTSGASRSSMTL
jgi:integrase